MSDIKPFEDIYDDADLKIYLENKNQLDVKISKIKKKKSKKDKDVAQLTELQLQLAKLIAVEKDRIKIEKDRIKIEKDAAKAIIKDGKKAAKELLKPTTETKKFTIQPAEEIIVEFKDDYDFIEEYVKYASNLTDAPLQFHRMMAKNILAIVVGKRVVAHLANDDLYTNQYNLIVAPPSARKSTVYKIGMRILAKAGFKMIRLPAQATPEAMAEEFMTAPHRLYVSDEFSIILKDSQKKYNSGIIEFFTKLYDSPDEYKLGRRDKPIDIKDPYLNIMAFIQPKNYIDLFANSQNTGSGFMQRFEIEYVEEFEGKPRKNWTDVKHGNDEKLLINFLKVLDSTLSKNLLISANFTQYQHDIIFELIESKYSKVKLLATFAPRLADYVYKNSMLVELSRAKLAELAFSTVSNNSIYTISDSTVLECINYAENKIISSIIELSANSANSANFEHFNEIRDKLFVLFERNNGVLYRKKIMQNLHLLSKEWDELLKEFKSRDLFKVIFKTNGIGEHYLINHSKFKLTSKDLDNYE